MPEDVEGLEAVVVNTVAEWPLRKTDALEGVVETRRVEFGRYPLGLTVVDEMPLCAADPEDLF